MIKKTREINADSTSHHDLSVLRRRRRSGRSVTCLARVFILFKGSRYGLDMPIEVEHRVVHLAVPRVTIYQGPSNSK